MRSRRPPERRCTLRVAGAAAPPSGSSSVNCFSTCVMSALACFLSCACDMKEEVVEVKVAQRCDCWVCSTCLRKLSCEVVELRWGVRRMPGGVEELNQGVLGRYKPCGGAGGGGLGGGCDEPVVGADVREGGGARPAVVVVEGGAGRGVDVVLSEVNE